MAKATDKKDTVQEAPVVVEEKAAKTMTIMSKLDSILCHCDLEIYPRVPVEVDAKVANELIKKGYVEELKIKGVK